MVFVFFEMNSPIKANGKRGHQEAEYGVIRELQLVVIVCTYVTTSLLM